MTLKQTPLHEEHVKLKARMVPFGGWDMPVQYTGVLAEHAAVRERAGLFDVSHMGEFLVTGKGAAAFLNQLTVNDVTKMVDGRCQYNVMCDDTGGAVDDIIVMRESAERYLVVVNASNIDKDFGWLAKHKPEDVSLTNESDAWALLAVQGPQSSKLIAQVMGQDFNDLRYYHFKKMTWQGFDVILSRTGYTGEDGFEIFVPARAAAKAWQMFLTAGATPAGLAARDTLRLEAAYPLYGHELTSKISPLEAGLGWVVKIDKGDFIGRKVLAKQKQEGLKRRLVGFNMTEAGIAREGAPVFSEAGIAIGFVTSGTHSPTLKLAIGLALLEYGVSGNILIEIRGQKKKAKIVPTPFYKGSAQK